MVESVKAIKNIKDLTVGEFIKVVHTNGPTIDRLNFSGEVIRLCELTERIEIKTVDYVVGIGWNMDGYDLDIFKLDQKPNGWDAATKTPRTIKTKEILPIKTKKDQVIELVKNNPRKKSTTLLALAKKEIGGDAKLLESYVQLALMRLNRLDPVK